MKLLKWIIPIVIIIVVVFVLFRLQDTPQVLTINDRLMEFRLKTLEGDYFFSNEHKGKVMLVSVWDTYCVYCIDEMVFIEGLNNELCKENFLAVSLLKNDNNIGGAKNITEKNNITYTALNDSDGKVSDMLGAKVTPYCVLIDSKGIIRFIHRGYSKSIGKKIEEEVRLLIEESKE